MRKAFLFVAVAALLFIFPFYAEGADFKFVTGAFDPPSDQFLDGTQCNIRLEGEIVAGDADRFEFFLASAADRIEAHPNILGYPRIATLCLNSIGGSLNEGIQIAELIRKDRYFPSGKGIPFVITRLEAGARCESACAIVFLSGTMDDFEGPAFPLRSMHPTAVLGFHAPALNIPGGQYDGSFVSTAYDTSINSIAEILRVLHVGEQSDGTPYSGNQSWLEMSLLEAMLRTPSSDMLYVRTVDEAGRWHIPVRPVREKVLDKQAGFVACLNQHAWAEGRRSRVPGELERNNGWEAPIEDKPGSSEVRRLEYTLDELNGIYCRISVRENGQFFFEPNMNSGSSAVRDMLALYDHSTLLSSLAPDAMDGAAQPVAGQGENVDVMVTDGVPWFPRFGGEKVSMWDHNESIMAWESRSNERWIWYYKPRPGIAKAGVTPGTLLFYGAVLNGVLTGTSRRFSTKCGETTFRATGRPNGTRVVLEGQYRSRDKDCNEGELKIDRSAFEYVAAAPADPTRIDGTAPEDRMSVTGVRTGLNMRDGPSAKAKKVGELPSGLSGLQLINCVPGIRKNVWGSAGANARAQLLAERWCSVDYNGITGYVSGRFLSVD